MADSTKITLVRTTPQQTQGFFAGLLAGYLWGSKHKHPVIGTLLGGTLGAMAGSVIGEAVKKDPTTG